MPEGQFVIQGRRIPLYSSPGVGQTVAGKTGSESISDIEAFQYPSLTEMKLAPTRFPGGKSGLHRAGCQVTPGRREPTESATENIPPAATLPVRVKWCGKSAPRVWQQTWQGKPHPEQDQIGERSCGPHGSRVGCLRCAVTCIPEEWLSTTEPGLPAGSLQSIWPWKHTE